MTDLIPDLRSRDLDSELRNPGSRVCSFNYQVMGAFSFPSQHIPEGRTCLLVSQMRKWGLPGFCLLAKDVHLVGDSQDLNQESAS